MLSRVLEPEVMDSLDEAVDYDAMNHDAVNAQFVTDFLAFHPAPREVLDVGTGTAQIPIALARRHPTVNLIGIDLAASMLDVGKANVARASLTARIQLDRIDARKLPFAPGQFDAAISNSIVHHLPQPLPVLAEMVRVVWPGGSLFVRDLLRPTNQESLDQLVETYAGDANLHQRQMFADSLHAAFTLDEVRDMVASLGYAADDVQQTSDRHWTWAARRP